MAEGVLQGVRSGIWSMAGRRVDARSAEEAKATVGTAGGKDKWKEWQSM
jgi:hypothetical protein